MADAEFEVIRRDGQVNLLAYDTNDDLVVYTLDPEDAAVLGSVLIDKAVQEEDDSD